jgi:hypothetical protein
LLDLLGSVLLSLMLAVVAWKTTQRALEDWDAGYKTATVALPLAPTWVVVSVLLAFSALVQFRLTWRAMTDLPGGKAHA